MRERTGTCPTCGVPIAADLLICTMCFELQRMETYARWFYWLCWVDDQRRRRQRRMT